MAEHDVDNAHGTPVADAVAETRFDADIERVLESLDLGDEDRTAVIDSFEPLQMVLRRPGDLSDIPPSIIRMTVWR